jgi:hypothetical protein
MDADPERVDLGVALGDVRWPLSIWMPSLMP